MRGTEDLGALGGLATSAPWLAALFLIPAASLAGIPPLSGFWAKLGVIAATVEAEAWGVLAAALGAGLLTLLSMVKIWNEAFWKEPSTTAGVAPPTRRELAAMVVPMAVLALLTVAIGLDPQALLAAAGRAASELLDVDAYRAAAGLVGSGP